MKRFTVTELFDIKDNLTGKTHVLEPTNGSLWSICKLMNDLNDRADRNAELVDMEKIDLMYQRDMYKKVCDDLDRIMRKHEIESLEKLDLMLEVQRVW